MTADEEITEKLSPTERRARQYEKFAGPIDEKRKTVSPVAEADTAYRVEMCDEVVRLGGEGASIPEIAFELGHSPRTLRRWAEMAPEFAEALEVARELSQGWWEKQGRRGIWSGSAFNANAYQLQMLNRFAGSWKLKREIDIPGGINVTITSEEAKY